MNPMQIKIEEATSQGRVGLIPFLPAGFPNREQFWKELEELDKAGAAVIEIGMPFSDPVADGPVVEKASLECLADGINLAWIFDRLNITCAVCDHPDRLEKLLSIREKTMHYFQQACRNYFLSSTFPQTP